MRAKPLTINGVKANVKQNETKELMVRSTYFQNLKCNVNNTCNFYLILFGIPSSLTSLVRNGEWGYELNKQDPLSMTKVISVNGP